MPIVKMPNGSTAQFPDDMKPEDIQREIESHMSSQPQPQPIGLPPGTKLPGFPAAPTPDMKPSQLGGFVNSDPNSGPNTNFKQNWQSNTAPMPSDGTVATAIHNVGARAAKTLVAPIAHPIQTAQGIGQSIAHSAPNDPENPMAQRVGEFANDYSKDKGLAFENAAGDLAGGFLQGEMAGPVIGAGMRGSASMVRGVAKLASATPESASLAATRVLSPGTAGETLVRATKPGIKYGPAGDIADSYQATLPKILEQNPKPNSVADFGNAADAAKDANASEYNAQISQYKSGQGTSPRPRMMDGNPVANAQMQSIPLLDRLENPATPTAMQTKTITVPSGPDGGTMRMGATSGGEMTGGIVNKTADVASNYRRLFEVPTFDALREGANQKLASLYNKLGGDQYAALANPETARVKAVGDSIRTQLYPAIDSDFGHAAGTTASHQQLYGQLSDAADASNKRSTVFSRQDPVSLSEKMAVGHGGPVATAFNFGKAQLLKQLTDSDGLVRSAVDRYQNPGGPMSSLQPRSGIIPQAMNKSANLAMPVAQAAGVAVKPSLYGAVAAKKR